MGFVLWYLRKFILNLNARDVGKSFDMSHTSVQKYESGDTKPTYPYVETFSATYNIPLDLILELYKIAVKNNLRTNKDYLKFNTMISPSDNTLFHTIIQEIVKHINS